VEIAPSGSTGCGWYDSLVFAHGAPGLRRRADFMTESIIDFVEADGIGGPPAGSSTTVPWSHPRRES
jgi:hypothetical protein